MNRSFKLKRCPHDPRDFIHQPERPMKAGTKKIDLSSKMPGVLDQGELATCSINAVSNALKYLSMSEKKNAFQPSRSYLYYTTRVFIDKHSPLEDNGTCIRSICKSFQKYHIVDEKLWPYTAKDFSNPPTLDVYRSAFLYRKIIYSAVPHNLITIKNTLFCKQPIIAGVSVYSSFTTGEVGNTGIIPMPDISVESLLGSHAILLVGLDRKSVV